MSITEQLQTYLNPDNLSGKDKIEEAFDKTAKLLFSSCTLKSNNSKYKLIEIEFYLHCKSHPDKFTHEHRVPFPTGCWRFHESGIDITILWIILR